jgi:hypothetical protein
MDIKCSRGWKWNNSGCWVCKFHSFKLERCLHPSQFGQMLLFADSKDKPIDIDVHKKQNKK